MKVGLFWDEAISLRSYYVKDSEGHTFDDNPYIYHHSVSSKCYPSTHNFTFLWGDGIFLNLSEWDNLPNFNFDVIYQKAIAEYDSGEGTKSSPVNEAMLTAPD